MVNRAVDVVILSIVVGERPRGFKNTVYWPGAGVMEFWRKRVMQRSQVLAVIHTMYVH